MVKYKKIGNKLAVKGLNSWFIIAAIIFSSVFLISFGFFWYITAVELSEEVILQLLLGIVFFIMLGVHLSVVKAFFKQNKTILIFDKCKGVVECYIGDRYRTNNVGNKLYWRFQKAIFEVKRKPYCIYHAVLVGSAGESYIGVSFFTVRGLKRRIRKLNEYIDGDIIVSENVIASEKALNKFINRD